MRHAAFISTVLLGVLSLIAGSSEMAASYSAALLVMAFIGNEK